MEVILRKDIEGVGKAGQIAKVKDGYARNFLFPNKLAVPSSPLNLKQLEQEKQHKAQQLEKTRKDAEALKEKLAGISVTMPVLVQEEEKLYGSISAQDIATALKEEGFTVDKSLIALEEPIKQLGIYEIPVKLHPEVTAKIKIWVVKK